MGPQARERHEEEREEEDRDTAERTRDPDARLPEGAMRWTRASWRDRPATTTAGLDRWHRDNEVVELDV